MTPTVGLYLPPDGAALASLGPALARCGHLEVVPETLWGPRSFNAFARAAAELSQRLGVPLVGHGVGWSVESDDPRHQERRGRWLERLAETQSALRFAWFTEHGGVTHLGSDHVMLPVAPPRTTFSLAAARRSLATLGSALGLPVGVENSVFYAAFDPPETEPGFLSAVVGSEHHLLLDLHNLVCLEENTGLSAEAWLEGAPLDRVIEVHVAGGRSGETLGAARPFRLDSHDDRVPERVWELLDAALPRLPGLRGLTLERLEGTISAEDVPGLVADLERAEAALRSAAPAGASPAGASPSRSGAPLPAATAAEHHALDDLLAEALRSGRPAEVLDRRRAEVPAALGVAVDRALADEAGLHVTARLVAQLRFSRLLQGSAEASAAFEADPAAFTTQFRAFHAAVPGREDPWSEALAWARRR